MSNEGSPARAASRSGMRLMRVVLRCGPSYAGKRVEGRAKGAPNYRESMPARGDSLGWTQALRSLADKVAMSAKGKAKLVGTVASPARWLAGLSAALLLPLIQGCTT